MIASRNVPQTALNGQPNGRTAISISSGPSSPLDDYQPKVNSYSGGLVLLAAFIPLPFFAALITLIAYLSPSSVPEVAFLQWLGSSNLVIIIGLIITIVLWLLLAIPCAHFARAEGGRPSDFASLQRDYSVLKNQLDVVKTATPSGQYQQAAIADIESNFNSYINSLNRNGLPWVLYTGYVSMWDRLNKVNEAMVGVLPRETVIESANYDELSLKDSVVPESQELLALLDKAINTLGSDSKGSKLKQVTDITIPAASNNGQVSQQNEQGARADIRKVKSALHKFTNERWDGLVRARNQLLGTAFLTAFFTYILVIIAVLANVPTKNIINAMVFYFLGAVVGLFGRLSDEKNADKVIDDYGLSMTRIIVTPLISGLAVLVGVLFVTTSTTLDSLYQISVPNLVLAAVLGFAPNLLINTLQNKSEEIKGQIKSAGQSDSKSGKGSSGSS